MPFAMKFPKVAMIGKRVSHAKNRHSRPVKYNLHTVTVTTTDGKKKRMRVPTKMLRMLKKAGLTTHFKKDEKGANDGKTKPTKKTEKTQSVKSSSSKKVSKK